MRANHHGHKWNKFAACGILLAILGLGCVAGTPGEDPLQPSIAEKILRFHVLANSDSQEDQALKLAVRDAVGGLMENQLKDAEDMEASRAIVTESIPEIIEIARQTIADQGYDYPVTAQLTHTEFPVKTYGDYTFPAGEYEALEVVIGEGEGHNWWCVLYPNMCFRDSVYEVVDSESDRKLRAVLTAQEYEDVFTSQKYEVHLKFLEFFQ